MIPGMSPVMHELCASVSYGNLLSGCVFRWGTSSSKGAIPPMCAMLNSQDNLVIQVILDGLGNILRMAGPQVKLIVEVIEEAGGVDKIESLQQHQNIEIYKIAYNLVDKYFSSPVSLWFGWNQREGVVLKDLRSLMSRRPYFNIILIEFFCLCVSMK